MAGFPCSAFLALYLTAITFLQGAAAMSVDRTTSVPVTTMPGSNVSLAEGKPPRFLAGSGQLQPQEQVRNGQSCPNCNNNNDSDLSEEIYKLRIEMIKAKILAKLQMDREPVLKEKSRDSRIAALLSNLNLIEENNEESVPKDSDDKYYGKTTKIIIFGVKAKVPPASRTKRNFSRKLVFQFKLEQKALSSSVPSASLWLHKRKSKRYELNGKILHIEAHDMKSHRGDTEVPINRVMKTKLNSKKGGLGWVEVDVKDILKQWFNKTAQQYDSSNTTDSNIRVIEISCLDCESEAGHLISSRGRLRPFLVIDLEKPRSRQKRAVVCEAPARQCCRRKLYVNFAKIGWDWILFPAGFRADYCEGSCDSHGSPINGYSYMLQEMTRRGLSQFSICCTPSQMSGVSMLYFDRDEDIIKRDVSDMRVDSCGCS